MLGFPTAQHKPKPKSASENSNTYIRTSGWDAMLNTTGRSYIIGKVKVEKHQHTLIIQPIKYAHGFAAFCAGFVKVSALN